MLFYCCDYNYYNQKTDCDDDGEESQTVLKINNFRNLLYELVKSTKGALHELNQKVNLSINLLVKCRRVARGPNPRLKLTLTELSRPVNHLVKVKNTNMTADLLSLFDLFDDVFPTYDCAHLQRVNLRRPKR